MYLFDWYAYCESVMRHLSVNKSDQFSAKFNTELISLIFGDNGKLEGVYVRDSNFDEG